METSPRAWRKPICAEYQRQKIRNISTCVEKTHSAISQAALKEKHLHVRGENLDTGHHACRHLETSPRAWRKPLPFTYWVFVY